MKRGRDRRRRQAVLWSACFPTKRKGRTRRRLGTSPTRIRPVAADACRRTGPPTGGRCMSGADFFAYRMAAGPAHGGRTGSLRIECSSRIFNRVTNSSPKKPRSKKGAAGCFARNRGNLRHNRNNLHCSIGISLVHRNRYGCGVGNL